MSVEESGVGGDKWFHLGDMVHKCVGVMRVTAVDVV